jgi:hypothetical protein
LLPFFHGNADVLRTGGVLPELACTRHRWVGEICRCLHFDLVEHAVTVIIEAPAVIAAVEEEREAAGS